MRRSLLLLAALTAALTLLPTACSDSGGGSPLKLRIELYGPPAPHPDPFEDVGFLRVIATAQGVEQTSQILDYGAQGGELADVPTGEDIQLTVEGRERVCSPAQEGAQCGQAAACDTPGTGCAWTPGGVVSRGRTGLLDIAPNAPGRAVAVFMTRTDSYAPTTSARLGAATRMVTGRVGHSATVLDDGRVLIVGGAQLLDGASDFSDPSSLGTVYATAEIFDPATGDFVAAGNGGLAEPRAFHRSVKLADGRVAIFGGYSRSGDDGGPIASVELYDPVTDTFAQGLPPMSVPRAYHTATVKADDRVVLIGGRGDTAAATWELWDPEQGPVAGTGGQLQRPRWNHTATYVPGAASSVGKNLIYILGGENSDGVLDMGELYSVSNDTLLQGVLPMVGATDSEPDRYQARTLHTANYVAGQNLIYVVGGYSDRAKTKPLDRIDVFQVGCSLEGGKKLDACWLRGVNLALWKARGGHSTVEMPGNALLITGGCGDVSGASCGIGKAEVIFQYDQVKETPNGPVVEHQVRLGFTGEELLWRRYLHQAVLLESRQVLLLGGARQTSSEVDTLDSAEIFNPL